MFDVNDPAVRRFIKNAKSRGFATLNQFGKILPPTISSSEEIETIIAQLIEMGVTIRDDIEDDDRAMT